MIAYATTKYGDDRVAQIITYGTIKSKQAIKDSTRVLGYPYALGERLTKSLPPSVMGKDISLSGIFNMDDDRYGEASEFRNLYEADPDSKRIVDTALGIEGLKRQWGVHAKPWLTMVAKKMPAMMGKGRLKRAANKKASNWVLSPISASATTPVDTKNDSMIEVTSR
jgi:hypothetical protein